MDAHCAHTTSSWGKSKIDSDELTLLWNVHAFTIFMICGQAKMQWERTVLASSYKWIQSHSLFEFQFCFIVLCVRWKTSQLKTNWKYRMEDDRVERLSLSPLGIISSRVESSWDLFFYQLSFKREVKCCISNVSHQCVQQTQRSHDNDTSIHETKTKKKLVFWIMVNSSFGFLIATSTTTLGSIVITLRCIENDERKSQMNEWVRIVKNERERARCCVQPSNAFVSAIRFDVGRIDLKVV